MSFAHRGARAHARENTLDAFELALKLGASGLETDAWLTADGVVVLDHDGVLRRRGRRIPISRVNRADLPDHIPTLRELLVLGDGAFDVSIDVKDPVAADAIVEDIRSTGFTSSRVWLCFDAPARAITARQRHSDVRIVDSSRLARIPEGVERRAAVLAEAGVDALNMHATDWTGGSVTLVHRFSLHAFGWDLQEHHNLRNGIRMGLDAVYSDHVDTMVDAFISEFGRAPRRD